MPIATLSDVGNVGQGVAALAAVGGLFFTGYQIRLGRQLERERLVSSYLERLNTRDFYNNMSTSRETINVPEADRDRVWHEFLSASLRRQQSYFLVMNLFEELATLYNDRLIDEHATRRLLGDTSRAYWAEVRWFVDRYRAESHDPTFFVEWEKMNARLASAAPRAHNRPTLAS